MYGVFIKKNFYKAVYLTKHTFEYKNHRGLIVTENVQQLIRESGKTEQEWSSFFPEWHIPEFAGHMLEMYIKIRDWTSKRENEQTRNNS